MFLWASCSRQEPTSAPEAPAPALEEAEVWVEVQALDSTAFAEEIVSNGRLQARQRAELRFKTGELLVDLPVRNGSRVEQGQLLARLDTTVLALRLDEARARLARADWEMQNLRISYGYAGKADDSIPPRILHSMRVQCDWYAAHNAVRQNALALSQSELRAPFAGTVANLSAKPFNTLQVGEPFCTLLDDSRLEAVFLVMEADLPKISAGLEVEVKTLSDSLLARGFVSVVNPTVGPSGMSEIRADLEPSPGFYDGMNVEVRVRRWVPGSLRVPKAALQVRAGQEVVFVYENGLAKWRTVRTQGQNTTHYRVVEGLKPGDQVIVSGNLNLAHDAKVKLRTPEP